MSDTKDGGPAFPAHTSRQDGLIYGMTLRDYFATHDQLDPNESIGLALAERLAGRSHPGPKDERGQIKAGGDPVDVAIFWADAEAAYRYLRADAMLRAREVRHD